MRAILVSIIFVILVTSFISGEILISEQPKKAYSIGEVIKLPVKITSVTDTSTFFTLTIICNGIETVVHKEHVSLSAGGEEKLSPSVPLAQEFMGRTSGTCKLKASQDTGEIFLTDEFKVSDKIIIKRLNTQESFSPGESLIIEGEAKKENGELVNGFVSVNITSQGLFERKEIAETVNKGYFYIDYPLPEDTKAGVYAIRANVFEKDLKGDMTSRGFIDYTIRVSQVPTNLEIIIENPLVEPGASLKVKTILHDQTGEKIDSESLITIRKNAEDIGEKFEQPTEEDLEYSIKYNEPPSKWQVIASSNELTSENNFEVIEKQSVRAEIINKTLLITNTGNTVYNKTVVIKIGSEEKRLELNLEVDGEQKYTLTAPEGEYQIEVLADGETKINQEGVMLTGKVVGIKETSSGMFSFIRHPMVWIFIIGIMGFVSYMVFKKGYKRSFFGYIYKGRRPEGKAVPLRKDSLVNTRSKAELSLTIKGEKQSASLVCLRIKNLKEVEIKKSNAKEVLQKIVDMAESQKAATYENQNDLFFIIAPIKTKTFKNEKTALDISQKAKQILEEYNKLAKQKIDFGISLNHGSIIAKLDKEKDITLMRFMSIGTLITTARKIASLADKDIFLSEKINDKLATSVRTNKEKKGNINVYLIKEVKKTEDHSKFLSSFLDRLEKDKPKKE